MFSRNKRGERRVSQPAYKLLLAAHILVSGVWLGIAAAKLVLAVAAPTTGDPRVSGALYSAMEVVNVAFPPAAVATLVTGVLLSLGTKWSLLRHYWVAIKLALTVGVIVTGVALVDRLIQQSVAATSGQAVSDGTMLSIASAPTRLLIYLSVAHVLMLGVATVISVYKPWGKIRVGRHEALSIGDGRLSRDEILYGSTVRPESRRHDHA